MCVLQCRSCNLYATAEEGSPPLKRSVRYVAPSVVRHKLPVDHVPMLYGSDRRNIYVVTDKMPNHHQVKARIHHLKPHVPLNWTRAPTTQIVFAQMHQALSQGSQVIEVSNLSDSDDESEEASSCDVCNCFLSYAQYYHCSICYDDNFDICGDCRALGATCLDDSHELSEET